MFEAEVKQSDIMPPCFSFYPGNSFLFVVYLVPCFFAFVCFLLVISLFKMAPEYNAEALSIQYS